MPKTQQTVMKDNRNSLNLNQPKVKIELDIQILALEGADVGQNVVNDIMSKGLRLAVLEEEFKEGVRRVQTNNELSGIGQNKQIQALSERVNKKLDALQHEVYTGLDAHIASLERKRVAKKLPGDTVANYMRELEYRNLLRGADSGTVLSQYQQACQSGEDPFLELAVENCPPGFPLITDDQIIEAGREMRLERDNPDTSKLLCDLRSMKASMIYLCQACRSEIQTA